MKSLMLTPIVICVVFSAAACSDDSGTPAATPQASVTIVGSPSATPVAAATPPVSTPAPAGSAAPVQLTDTGFVAPDGRPLWAECIADGAPLPPELPVPSDDQSLAPKPDPGRDLNEGKEAPKDLPAIDLRTIPAADAAAWPVSARPCYGYSLRTPPGWAFSPEFVQSGYQQGESATLRSPRGDAKIEISTYFTPVDYLAIALSPPGIGQGEYALDVPRGITFAGVRGVESYTFIRGELTGVVLSRLLSPSQGWYVTTSAYLLRPYDEKTAAELRAVVESLEFPR